MCYFSEICYHRNNLHKFCFVKFHTYFKRHPAYKIYKQTKNPNKISHGHFIKQNRTSDMVKTIHQYFVKLYSQSSIRKYFRKRRIWRQTTQIASSNDNRILIANIYTMHFVYYYGHLHAEPCTQSYESYIL